MPTRGIPYPTGDPSLDPAAERAWRRQLLEKALEAVATEVDGPTLFEPGEPGRPEGMAAGSNGQAQDESEPGSSSPEPPEPPEPSEPSEPARA